jgi:hypothetical protein
MMKDSEFMEKNFAGTIESTTCQRKVGSGTTCSTILFDHSYVDSLLLVV